MCRANKLALPFDSIVMNVQVGFLNSVEKMMNHTFIGTASKAVVLNRSLFFNNGRIDYDKT